MRIGVIGAGRMGRPIVDRLAAAGYQPTVLTRRPESRAEAEIAGLSCAGTVQETVEDADVVLNVVFDEQQVKAALLGPRGAITAMRAGAVLVQHTTCDPATVEMITEVAANRGVRVLDAAVSGNPRDIAAGQLTLWVGGDESALDEVRPPLGAYASPVMFVGPAGNGQRVKLVNNALFVAQVGLAVDAVRFAEAIGIPEAEILSAIQHGSGGSRALSSVAWMGADGVGIRLSELLGKDINVLRAVAGRARADLGLIGDVLSSDVVTTRVLRDSAPPAGSAVVRSQVTPGAMKEPANG
jgi:3-hydroxyisobutyrate dehydrogenase-like beta-hydroxyacid dehydrogenase